MNTHIPHTPFSDIIIYSPSPRRCFLIYKALPPPLTDGSVPVEMKSSPHSVFNLIRSKWATRAKIFVTCGLGSEPQSIHTGGWSRALVTMLARTGYLPYLFYSEFNYPSRLKNGGLFFGGEGGGLCLIESHETAQCIAVCLTKNESNVYNLRRRGVPLSLLLLRLLVLAVAGLRFTEGQDRVKTHFNALSGAPVRSIENVWSNNNPRWSADTC